MDPSSFSDFAKHTTTITIQSPIFRLPHCTNVKNRASIVHVVYCSADAKRVESTDYKSGKTAAAAEIVIAYAMVPEKGA
jgi:hypothetical protein